MIRAVGMLSGGLDSTLAAKILIDQGVEVHAINFTSPFCTCTPKKSGCSAVARAVEKLGNIPLKQVAMGDDYLAMVKSPRHGHGRGMNPCIDCRIMKIKKAAEYMREIGAQFLFTGEVLGQRPMSQHRTALDIIEKQSGMQGLILRPLSAKLLEPTVPERKGWVNRDALCAVSGRSRKEQIGLAAEKGINDYPCPAGGCLLTDGHFAERLRDYFEHTATPSVRDMPLLKIGRHFRMPDGGAIVVARDSPEGDMLLALAKPLHYVLVPTNFSAPAVLTDSPLLSQALEKMLAYTHRDVPANALIELQHEGKTLNVARDQWKTVFSAGEERAAAAGPLLDTCDRSAGG